MKFFIFSLLLLFLAGCMQHAKQFPKDGVTPYFIVPYPSVSEIESGRKFTVTFVIYNTSKETVQVPDPQELQLHFINFNEDDPQIDLGPFNHEGAIKHSPKPSIALKTRDSVSAKISVVLVGEGVFLISAWGYDKVMVPVIVHPDHASEQGDGGDA